MKKVVLIAVLVTILIFSFSIETTESETSLLEDDEYITYNMEKKPYDLIMTDNKNVRDKDLLVSLFEGLVRLDNEGNIVPGLAESYEISDNKIQYKFKLRENIRYSNGDKITAADFVKFFEEFLGDEDNIYKENLYCIFGAKDFAKNPEDFSKVAITAVDDLTLTIRLNNPCEEFLYTLTNPVLTLRNYLILENDTNINKNVVCTGPFVIEGIRENGEIIILKNKNYYKNAAVTKEKILIAFIGNKEKSLAYFEEQPQKVDIMLNPPINELLRLNEEDLLQGFKSDASVYLNFNLNKDLITSDLNFRNAINSAMSKEYFINNICKEFGNPATSYAIGQGKKFSSYGNDELALKYLKSSKYDDENIVLLYKDDPIEKRIVEDLAKDIKEDLNINIILKSYNNNNKEELIKEGFHMILEMENGKKEDYFLQWSNKESKSIYGFSDEKYNEIILKLKDPHLSYNKQNLYEQCENILKSKLPSIPIYNLNNILCKNENIKDVYINRHGNIVLYNLKRDVSYLSTLKNEIEKS
ncbi:MAG: ABC transporter substrate-binding protein [Clostridium sp.]